MDSYYKSEKFKNILRKYEEGGEQAFSSFLDSEELTDIAEYYHLKGNVEKATEAALYALQIYPGAVSPLAFLSRFALLTENNPEKAEELAEEIIDKTDPEYFYLKAEILLASGKTEEADLYLHDCLESTDEEDKEDFIIDVATLFADYDEDRKTEEWLNISNMKESSPFREIQARLLNIRGKYEESEKILNELLDENPYSGIYWNSLAQNQFLRNNFQESVTSSEYSIAINPDDDEALLNKANSLYSLGNYKDAIEYYNKYKKAGNNNDQHIISVTIGHLYLLLNNMQEAYNYFSLALKESKETAVTLIHIAISAFDNGYLEFAYQLLSRNLPKVGNNWNFGYAHLARCCFELGYQDEYEQRLKTAIKKNQKECKEILEDLYPKNTLPKDYPNFRPRENNSEQQE